MNSLHYTKDGDSRKAEYHCETSDEEQCSTADPATVLLDECTVRRVLGCGPHNPGKIGDVSWDQWNDTRRSKRDKTSYSSRKKAKKQRPADNNLGKSRT